MQTQLSQSAQIEEPSKMQTCPNCQQTIPVYAGYVTWCECGWNLKPQEPLVQRGKFGYLFDTLYQKAGQRFSRSLYDAVVEEQSIKPNRKPATLLALLVASVVHLVTILVFALGVLVIVDFWPHVYGFVYGVLCFALTWAMRPRFGKMPKKVLSREKYPTLYEVVDEVSEAIGTSKVDGIVLTSDYNAAFAQVGLRRQKVLYLGLPLFAPLTGQEKVSLIGHEVAHGANGDPNRSLFLQSAIESLTNWYYLAYPDPLDSRRQRNLGSIGSAMVFVNLLMGIFAQLIKYLLVVLVHQTYRESQRAEYYADAVAAETSGTDAMMSLLEKLHLFDAHMFAMQKVSLNKGLNYFTYFKERMETMPERELERIRRVELMESSRLDTTHPPTAYRVGYLKERHVQVPRYEISATMLERLEKELLPLQQEVQGHLVAWYQRRLYM